MNALEKSLVARLMMGAFSLLGPVLNGEVINIEGTFNYRVTRNNQIKYVETKDFILAIDVNSDRWIIRTAKPGSINYTEKSYVGDALYTLSCEYLQTNGNSFRANVGKIEEFPVPDPDGSRINTLWLGYGSAAYFKKRTNNLVHPHWPLDDPGARLRGFTVEGRWALNKDALGLPISVVYLSDGIFRGVSDRTGQTVSFPEPPPFNQGFTQAVFMATLSTNVGAYRVPLEYTFKRFAIENGKYELLTEETASARHVELRASRDNFLPLYIGKVDIGDGRFRVPNFNHPNKFDYFTYSSSNGVWPTFAQVAAKYGVLTDILQQHHGKTKREVGNKSKRIMILSVMLFSAVPLIMYLVQKHLKKRKEI